MSTEETLITAIRTAFEKYRPAHDPNERYELTCTSPDEWLVSYYRDGSKVDACLGAVDSPLDLAKAVRAIDYGMGRTFDGLAESLKQRTEP